MNPDRRSLNYLVFSADWDAQVGNERDQLLRPRRAGDADRREAYFAYLCHSLGSFLRQRRRDDWSVRVWWVEIDQPGAPIEPLAERLSRELSALPVELARVPHRVARSFVEEARAMPASVYRSPNRLHEAAMLYALQRSSERYVVFADPDVTFVSPGGPEALVGYLAERPHKWAAAFVEPAKPKPWNGEVLLTRERMHSVFVVFDGQALRGRFPFDVFTRPTSFTEQLGVLCDAEASAYFARYRVLDTLSLVTEWLRSSCQVDRLLPLNTIAPRFHEGQLLTLVCEQLVHSKWAEPTSREALEEALAAAGLPLVGEELTSLYQRCRHG